MKRHEMFRQPIPKLWVAGSSPAGDAKISIIYEHDKRVDSKDRYPQGIPKQDMATRFSGHQFSGIKGREERPRL
jgi:hypothetical protein